MPGDEQLQRYSDDAVTLGADRRPPLPAANEDEGPASSRVGSGGSARRQRDEVESRDGELSEKQTRGQAGTLAWIGLAVEQSRRDEGDGDVVVEHAWFICSALNAADEAGLVPDRGQPRRERPTLA